MELNKIKEGTPEEGVTPSSDLVKEDLDSDFDSIVIRSNSDVLSELSSVVRYLKFYCPGGGFNLFFFRFKVTSCIEDLHKKFEEYLSKWSQTGYMHIFLNSCAILCFSISIFTLLRIFLEQDYSKSSLVGLFSWKKK